MSVWRVGAAIRIYSTSMPFPHRDFVVNIVSHTGISYLSMHTGLDMYSRYIHVGILYIWSCLYCTAYICASLEGTTKRSSPTKALPVALMRFSPLLVSGMSVLPVCLAGSSDVWSVMLMRRMDTRICTLQGFSLRMYMWPLVSMCMFYGVLYDVI